MLTVDDLVKWSTVDLNELVQRRQRALRFMGIMLKAAYASPGYSGWQDLVWEIRQIKDTCLLLQNIRKALHAKGDVTPW